MPAYVFRVAGPLAVTLAVGMAPPAVAAPYVAAAGRKAKSCKIASFYKIDRFKRRNFYIPGTRYVDGPGGVMRVWVMRAYTVRAEFEIEDWHEREGRRTRFGPAGPRDAPAEVTREVEVERERERGSARRRASGADGDGADGEDEVTRVSKVIVKDGRATLTRGDQRELVRAIRHMVSPLISDDHTVEVGHEYTRQISKGKYGHVRYRVFGYRVGFSKWWRGDDCRVHWAASGVAGVPARVEGWVYRESKRPNPKWLRGR